MNPKLLIVDDERGIVDMIQSYFQTQYDILTAYSGQEALKKVACKPDLILLDINMPGMDGLTVCQQIREHIACPILFLTARIESSDKIIGFQAGADDYIVKPFEAMELLARVEVVLRRTNRGRNVLQYQNIVVNIDEHTVKKSGEAVALTPKEFDVLVFFLQNPDILLTRERLLESVWGYGFAGESRTVDIHVQQMRRKMGLQKHLITIPKLGYRLEK